MGDRGNQMFAVNFVRRPGVIHLQYIIPLVEKGAEQNGLNTCRRIVGSDPHKEISICIKEMMYVFPLVLAVCSVDHAPYIDALHTLSLQPVWVASCSEIELCSSQPIRTRYLGHVTDYQPIRDQYFLIRSVPDLVVYLTCLAYDFTESPTTTKKSLSYKNRLTQVNNQSELVI
eukprot:sb/3472067/